MEVLRLKITLDGSSRLIWRRILVPASYTFLELHVAIQIAMGWENYHLAEFRVGKLRIGMPDEGFADPGLIDYAIAPVGPTLAQMPELKSFQYWYDFGDGWYHTIHIQKTRARDLKPKLPMCLDGEKACPPEDCGGIHGYYHMLEAVANRKHPDHKLYKSWLRKGFDPDRFNIHDVNFNLSQVREFLESLEREKYRLN